MNSIFGKNSDTTVSSDTVNFAKKASVDSKFDSWTTQLVKKSWERMSGNLNMQGNDIDGLANPTRPLHAVNKQYVDAMNNRQVSKRGDTMTRNF